MRKIGGLVTCFIVCMMSISSFSWADPAPIEGIPSDPDSDMSSDQAVFADLLNDTNRARFAKMSSSKRIECMHMTGLYNITGKTLSPDQAVEKIDLES